MREFTSMAFKDPWIIYTTNINGREIALWVKRSGHTKNWLFLIEAKEIHDRLVQRYNEKLCIMTIY